MVHHAGARAPRKLTLDLERVTGLPAEEVSLRARTCLRYGDAARRTAAFYLADLHDRELWRPLGYASWRHYVRRCLNMPLTTADVYARIGRELERLPEIDAEFAAGRVRLSAVKELVKVAVPETSAAWAATAVKLREQRRIAAAVKGRQKGDLPPKDAELRRMHTETVVFSCEQSPTSHRLTEAARRKLEAESGGGRVTDTELFDVLKRTYLGLEPDGSLPGWTRVPAEVWRIHALPGAGPDELIARDEDGETVVLSRRELERGLRAADAAHERDMQRRYPTLAELDPDNHRATVPPEQQDEKTDDALRARVLARDGYRCVVCGAAQNLMAHHLHWRRYGGRTVSSNLVTLCEGCHSKVHDRLMILVFEPMRGLVLLGPDGRSLDLQDEEPLELPPTRPAPAEERAPAEEPTELRRGRVAPTTRLNDLVGQEEVRERLRRSIAATKQRGEPLGAILFSGGAGLGKSALAEAIAGELGVPCVRLCAGFVTSPERLVRELRALPEGAVFYMDELHALAQPLAELLHEPLDRGTLSLPGEGTVPLPRFTFVGATTEEHRVPVALRSRLRVERVRHYSPVELAEIARRQARSCGFELEPGGGRLLALASRDTPREVLRLLRDVRDEATLQGVGVADEALVRRCLVRHEIDEQGWGPLDREYVALLHRAGGPVALSTLAACLRMSEGEVRELIEDFLHRHGWIEVTPRGRTLRATAGVNGPPPRARA